MNILAKALKNLWKHILLRGRCGFAADRVLELGARVMDEEITRFQVSIPHSRRTEHIAILGKTGTGKSFLLRHLCRQDIEAGRGFAYFDLHGDATPFLLAAIAEQERRSGKDLSAQTIVVEPADPDFSVGRNPLEQGTNDNRFVQIAEFALILKQRWHLDTFGARTEELLRNSLYVLAENGLTLLELSPLLSNSAFRANCLKELHNAEVRRYFEQRYDQASEPMRTVMREPILNKTSAFTADIRFRHIVGQQASTFSLREALDQGLWVILNLDKGRLGEQALTLGSLLLTVVKNALFSRTDRRLFTLYCDEIQNLVAFGGGLEILLSEARKFGISVTSANQFLDQYPAEMRAAILAVGTHVFFRLSSSDAQAIAAALDGGRRLAERLKNLPKRHIVMKSGHERWVEVRVPTVNVPKVDYGEFYDRCRRRWARPRDEVEREIARRQVHIAQSSQDVLHDWQ